MWVTRQETRTLTVLGLLALGGLGVLGWQRYRPPLLIRGAAQGIEVAQWERALSAARAVDINTADTAELERLPNVGPVLARRIVAERDAHGSFRSIEELSRVKGIGPTLWSALAPYVSVNSRE